MSNTGNVISSGLSSAASVATGSSSSYKPTLWDNFVKYGLIVVVLAFLGINLFTYFGWALDDVTKVFQPVLRLFGHGAADVVDQTVDVTADGVKGAVGAVTDVPTAVGGAAGTDADGETEAGGTPMQLDEESKVKQIAGAEKALQRSMAELNREREVPKHPAPDSGTRSVTGQSGYCYLGSAGSTRSCVKVGPSDTCMSGEVFGSEALCLDPNLRR